MISSIVAILIELLDPRDAELSLYPLAKAQEESAAQY